MTHKQAESTKEINELQEKLAATKALKTVVVFLYHSVSFLLAIGLSRSKAKLSPSFVEAEVAASVQEHTTLQETFQCSAAFSHFSLVSYKGDHEQLDSANSASFNIYI